MTTKQTEAGGELSSYQDNENIFSSWMLYIWLRFVCGRDQPSPAQPEYFLKTEDNSLEMFCPK